MWKKIVLAALGCFLLVLPGTVLSLRGVRLGVDSDVATPTETLPEDHFDPADKTPRGPIFYDNQPLKKPTRFGALREPALVVVAGGKTHVLYGIKLTGPVDVTDILKGEDEPFEVEIVNPMASASKVNYRSRILYCCGNYFTPSFPPKRFPRYGSSDLGTRLVGSGLALPTAEILTDDPVYAKELVDYLDMVLQNGRLRANSKEAEKLGRLLLPSYEHGVTAIRLLHFSGASDAAAAAKDKVHEYLQQGPREYWGYYNQRVVHAVSVLSKISPEEGKKEALRIIEGYGTDHSYLNLKVEIAKLLVKHGDWSGVDSVVCQSIDARLDSAYRGVLSWELQRLFRYYPHDGRPYEELQQRMADWYRTNKPRLKWNGEILEIRTEK